MKRFTDKITGYTGVVFFAAVLCVLIISAVCSGAYAADEEQNIILAAADTVHSTAPVMAGEYHPPVLIVLPGEKAEQTAAEINIVSGGAVEKALKRMKLTPDHLRMWAEKREYTMLKKLFELPEDQQRRVAAIACYIRKCNGSLSAENVWREAAAAYFYGKQYAISPEMVAAVAKAESTFNPNCRSRHGACGVMQVVYRVHGRTLERHGITSSKQDIFDPERGIHAGVYVLKGYLTSAGSVYKGLMRYLGGHSKRYYMRVQNNMAKIMKVADNIGL